MIDSLRKSIKQKIEGLDEASLRTALSAWLDSNDLSSQNLETQLKKILAAEFRELSRALNQEAQDNGLSPEILQSIFNEEKQERILEAKTNASRH